MILINKQSDFNKICEVLSNEKILYMDTEFHRRKTYYAILSIIQISTPNQKIIIDALNDVNLSALKTILLDPLILKVFHSPDQDFEIFLKLFGTLPKNVFDTQIAANVCGMEEGMGYSKLCKTMLNIDIDKTLQKADWLERPLSQDLMEYAIRDTEFLIPLHRMLSSTLTNRKLWDNYNSKTARLLDSNSYKFSPEKIIQKMDIKNKSEKFLHNLLQFILLREECSQILNIPRNHCAKDHDLILLSTHLPTTNEQLNKLYLGFIPLCKNQFRNKIFDLSEGLKTSKS
ncbi:Ribonuclease D [Candidatus Megaera polyxenophila]|jgi:ribonuclease D|nr:Ribonuclease D [Candidatus Megaera polyxenophila]